MSDLATENERLKRELAEALYALRKLTGCDWEETIAARAHPSIVRSKCSACGGLGELPLDAWSRMADVEPMKCNACQGSGDVYNLKE